MLQVEQIVSTRAIINRGSYIYYPIFEDHFFVFKEVIRKLCPYVRLVFKSELWWRAYGIFAIFDKPEELQINSIHKESYQWAKAA